MLSSAMSKPQRGPFATVARYERSRTTVWSPAPAATAISPGHTGRLVPPCHAARVRVASEPAPPRRTASRSRAASTTIASAGAGTSTARKRRKPSMGASERQGGLGSNGRGSGGPGRGPARAGGGCAVVGARRRGDGPCELGARGGEPVQVPGRPPARRAGLPGGLHLPALGEADEDRVDGARLQAEGPAQVIAVAPARACLGEGGEHGRGLRGGL